MWPTRYYIKDCVAYQLLRKVLTTVCQVLHLVLCDLPGTNIKYCLACQVLHQILCDLLGPKLSTVTCQVLHQVLCDLPGTVPSTLCPTKYSIKYCVPCQVLLNGLYCLRGTG